VTPKAEIPFFFCSVSDEGKPVLAVIQSFNQQPSTAKNELKLKVLVFDFVFFFLWFKSYVSKKECKSLFVCETADNICCPVID